MLPLSLVVFAYNEEANVASVVGDVLAWLRDRGAPYELLFVDDGSTDGTRAAAQAIAAAEPNCRVLVHDRNMGIGAALKTGVRAASLPWVSFLPCDGQIAGPEIDVLCRAAVRDDARAVFSVYRGRDDGLHRRLFSAGLRALIVGMLGVHLRCEGPYLFRRELFDPDRLPPNSFFLNFEFPIRLLRAGERIPVEVIECRRRRAGISKSTGFRRIAGVARDLADLRLRLWRGR